MSLVRDLPPYFVKTHFNIILSTPGFFSVVSLLQVSQRAAPIYVNLDLATQIKLDMEIKSLQAKKRNKKQALHL